MRWSGVMLCAAVCACAVLAASAAAATNARAVSPATHPATEKVSTKIGTVGITVVPFEESARRCMETGAALGAVVRGVVEARAVGARVEPPPAECAAAGPDAPACARAALAALARGRLAVALVPVARVPPAHHLRDAGLEALGDAAPPAHRACLVTAGPARSLLDLSHPATAALYHLSSECVSELANNASTRYFCLDEESPTMTACHNRSKEYATMITSDGNEASILVEVIREHALLAEVVVVETSAARVAETLGARPALVCGRGVRAPPAARVLGPPPCLSDSCPFETRRLIKFVNVRELANSPSIIRSLGRLILNDDDLVQLRNKMRVDSPEAAARELVAAHPTWISASGEVRMAVMIPATTLREAYDAVSLRAAAELAELDLVEEAPPTLRRLGIEFKVELIDDGCAATKAFKYLTDSLGTEFEALSGVAGPACGGAFGDVTRQSPAFSLPVVAYTAQARPPGEGARLTLLAAGDAGAALSAWAALFAHFGWRRVAVLSDLATRAAFDQAHLAVDVIYHKELSEDGDDHDDRSVVKWVEHIGEMNARIMYLSVEDARVVREALCAGRAAGLAPAAGAVWVLAGALPAGWPRPAHHDTHNCTHTQLEEMAEGHLSVRAEWAAEWEGRAAAEGAVARWGARWAARCAAARGAACASPPHHAALLYDVLRLWAAALDRLLAGNPAALDDLHRDDIVRYLIEDTTRTPYTGLTGPFEWRNGSRVSALVIQQWVNGSYVGVGRWGEGALHVGAVRWGTADGGAPDDGGERCTLRGLADALHVECRVAFAVVASLALAVLLTALAGGAWHCRRRAEREFRARLVALDMRAIATKPGGLDRWEVPRERVVINRKLGTGAFGTVYGGHALLAEDRGWSAVAVKTLKAGATTEEKLDFLSEAEAMKRFDHKNVVRLLGVVTKTEPVCTVMEYMLYGDLKNYLVARRHLAGGGGPAAAEVSPARLTSMALDVARALSYLAQLRYVHRDVAARNCLVSANRIVKLADFGMTRLVFENDYYRFSRKGMLPVRWMAPESLTLGVFSPASDVWSFGVLLYEIVTFGCLPFQGLSNSEVLERVKSGYTLDIPSGLKPQLEGLIKSCWQRERRARPGAAAVAAFLAESPRLLAPCLDVPLDALSLDTAAAAEPPAHARWLSWAAPTSAATDSTYLSTDAPPRDTDAFLPEPPT